MRKSGYSTIEFIPPERRSGIETPDLKAYAEHGSALLEVKTLQISDEEIRARSDIKARSTETALSEGFLEKLGRTICKARSQLISHELENVATRIIFVIPNFDDWPGQYKSNYYTDIDSYLRTKAPNDCAVVFFNSRTAFHAEISMQNAQVVNE